MRKIRIFEHISLDGVIEPGERGEDYAHGGWAAPYRSAAGAAALAETQGSSFDLLLGRRTYDLWAAHWPTVKGGPFADGLNAATKYVATHRPESLGWGPVGKLGANVMEGIRTVKSTDGPDLIVWGSSTLTSALLDQGLVDEVVLVVYPTRGGTKVTAAFHARLFPSLGNSPSDGVPYIPNGCVSEGECRSAALPFSDAR